MSKKTVTTEVYKESLNKEERIKYLDICYTIWGCAPIDFNWALQTTIYKNEDKKRNLHRLNPRSTVIALNFKNELVKNAQDSFLKIMYR